MPTCHCTRGGVHSKQRGVVSALGTGEKTGVFAAARARGEGNERKAGWVGRLGAVSVQHLADEMRDVAAPGEPLADHRHPHRHALPRPGRVVVVHIHVDRQPAL